MTQLRITGSDAGASPQTLPGLADRNGMQLDVTSPGLVAFGRWAESLLPFLLLFLCVFIYQHSKGLFIFVWLTCTLAQGNVVIRAQVALKEARQPRVLLPLVYFLIIQVWAVHSMFGADELWRCAVFIADYSKPLPFFDLIWAIAVEDLVVRHVGMTTKALTVTFAAGALPYRRLGQLLMLEEAVLGLYRDIVPVPLWLSFLSTWPSGSYLLPSGLIRACYLTLKVKGVVQKLKLVGNAIESVASRQSPFGRYVRPEELAASPASASGGGGGGCMCPICHENATGAVRLACSHVFCEDCIAQWLQRDQTCPICRSQVQTTSNQFSSDGTTSILPVVF